MNDVMVLESVYCAGNDERETEVPVGGKKSPERMIRKKQSRCSVCDVPFESITSRSHHNQR